MKFLEVGGVYRGPRRLILGRTPLACGGSFECFLLIILMDFHIL